jgi:hypothetical protein
VAGAGFLKARLMFEGERWKGSIGGLVAVVVLDRGQEEWRRLLVSAKEWRGNEVVCYDVVVAQACTELKFLVGLLSWGVDR